MRRILPMHSNVRSLKSHNATRNVDMLIDVLKVLNAYLINYLNTSPDSKHSNVQYDCVT